MGDGKMYLVGQEKNKELIDNGKLDNSSFIIIKGPTNYGKTYLTKYIADYYIELEGKVDAIVMTAGVGENGIVAREEILGRLKPLGIKVDKKANDKIASFKDQNEGIISAKSSSIPVYVVPTNEELMIIKDTYEFCK